MFKKLWSFAGAHKILTLIVLAAIAGGGYYLYKIKTAVKTETRYVMTTAAKDTIVTTVTGSGQVASSDQVDLKPKASGDVLTYNMKAGEAIKAGQILVSLDATNALKTVTDSQDSLISAQLSLEKLQQAADSLTLLQAQNSLTSAKEAKAKDTVTLGTDYDNAYNDVSGAYLSLPNIMSGLDTILNSSSFNGNQSNVDAYADAARRYDKGVDVYYNAAKNDYQTARQTYDMGFTEYKISNRTQSTDATDSLLGDTTTVVQQASTALKSASNLIQFYQDTMTTHGSNVAASVTSQLNTLDGYTSTTNSMLSGLSSAFRTIQNDKNSLVADDRTIAERQGSLDKVTAPPDPIDLRNAQLSVQQRQSDLDAARTALADYVVRAPFDGIVAAVSDLKRGDAVSTGTTLGTVITNHPIAKLSLNEIDVAKVKAGQSATLTFDALPDLSITGHVIEVDTLGTTSQGVVSYGVQVAFDTTDDSVKPGMTVSASIITQAKTDALAVPNSAVKNSNGTSYVETVAGATAADAMNVSGILAPNGTQRVTVTTGISSDTETEILTGLNEGDVVVSRAVTAAAAAPAAASRSILQAAGAGGGGVRTGGGGGTFRPPGN